MAEYLGFKYWVLRFLRISVIGFTLSCSSGFALGQQIQPDNTLGLEKSVVSPDNTLIMGGATREKNLFHSFREFNIDENQSVYFDNPTGIERIITRVTGNNRSQISGKLGVSGKADLFFINPNGITFGQNATLDLNGSFLGTTASSIIFPDSEFSTIGDVSSPLSIKIPSGLRFRDAGTIINKSKAENPGFFGEFGLRVQPGKTLALIGGNVTMDGGILTALEGNIELGSVAGNGQVGLMEPSWTLDYNTALLNFGDITLRQKSSIDTSDIDGTFRSSIHLQGKNIKIADGSQISALGFEGPGGFIEIKASDSFELTGFFPGTLRDRLSGLSTSSFSDGSGGDISIESKNVFLRDRAYIQTASSFIESSPGNFIKSNGQSGRVSITTSRLEISGGATINTSTSAEGIGGSIQVTATDSINVFGGSTKNGSPSSLFTGTDENSSGSAGDITLDTPLLRIADGSEVSVRSFGTGAAGNLNVLNASSIILENSGILSADTGAGSGNITLNSNNVFLRSNSRITTNAVGAANGGNIIINTGVLAALENSNITANAVEGFGGDVTINASGIFISSDSKITAASEAGPQFSGTVNLNTTATDPDQGLVELPTTVLDPNRIVSQHPCDRGWNSSFTLKGRGGNPQTLRQDLSADAIQVGLVEAAPMNPKTAGVVNNQIASTNLQQPTDIQIVPAQGWVYNRKGEVTLVAYNPTLTAQQRLQQQAFCSANE